MSTNWKGIIHYIKRRTDGDQSSLNSGQSENKDSKMQAKRAAQLRKAWGDKPCEHPSFDKLYYLGAQDFDMVCEQCGEEIPKARVKEIQKRRRLEADSD